MSERNGGAASAAPLGAVSADSATPALADQWEAEAIEAIEGVQDPAEAERLLGKVSLAAEAMRLQRLGADRERRWKVLRLKAERRYGELLPPKQPGKRTDRQPLTGSKRSNADHAAANKARKVADVPREAFDAYMESDPEPTREGLLRTSDPRDQRQRNDAGRPLWQDEAVLTFVARRLKAKRTRDQIITESTSAQHGWPLPGRKLSRTAADCAIATVRDRQQRGDTPRRRAPSEGGTRLRQLHADKRAGLRDPESDLWKMQVSIAETISVLERIELPDVEWNEDVGHMLNEIVYDLERHRAWSDRQFDAAWAHMDDLGRQRRLGELRKRAADPSSTQSEREVAANLLEKHERKYLEQKALR